MALLAPPAVQPYLPELCSLVLCLLEGAMQQAEQAQQQGAEPGDEVEAQGRREVRTRCLRLLAGGAARRGAPICFAVWTAAGRVVCKDKSPARSGGLRKML